MKIISSNKIKKAVDNILRHSLLKNNKLLQDNLIRPIFFNKMFRPPFLVLSEYNSMIRGLKLDKDKYQKLFDTFYNFDNDSLKLFMADWCNDRLGTSFDIKEVKTMYKKEGIDRKQFLDFYDNHYAFIQKYIPKFTFSVKKDVPNIVRAYYPDTAKGRFKPGILSACFDCLPAVEYANENNKTAFCFEIDTKLIINTHIHKFARPGKIFLNRQADILLTEKVNKDDLEKVKFEVGYRELIRCG